MGQPRKPARCWRPRHAAAAVTRPSDLAAQYRSPGVPWAMDSGLAVGTLVPEAQVVLLAAALAVCISVRDALPKRAWDLLLWQKQRGEKRKRCPSVYLSVHVYRRDDCGLPECAPAACYGHGHRGRAGLSIPVRGRRYPASGPGALRQRGPVTRQSDLRASAAAASTAGSTPKPGGLGLPPEKIRAASGRPAVLCPAAAGRGVRPGYGAAVLGHCPGALAEGVTRPSHLDAGETSIEALLLTTLQSPGRGRDHQWAPRRTVQLPTSPGIPPSVGSPKAPYQRTNQGSTGLRSVDRNNKATRLLTRPDATTKSYAKDLSPRMVKLQCAS